MTMQHIKFPLQPYPEPQRRWVERSEADIDRYLDVTYADDREARALDGMFLHVAADVIWETAAESPAWHRLSVLSFLMVLASSPAWDEAFLLHACAAVAAFYRWLERSGVVAADEVEGLLGDLDRRMAETLASLGFVPSGLIH